MLHSGFLIPILKELGKRGIHRTIDTTGFASRTIVQKFAENTDLFLFDLKMIDSKKHLKFTGQNNETILSNLKWLSASGAEIIIRIPLIKGVNTEPECILKMVKLVSSLKGKPKQINLLPYHDIAKMKYEKLGGTYQPENISTPSDNEIEEIIKIFENSRISVSVGG
jgi:pyruvate formate lyase activating enzyme